MRKELMNYEDTAREYRKFLTSNRERRGPL